MFHQGENSFQHKIYLLLLSSNIPVSRFRVRCLHFIIDEIVHREITGYRARNMGRSQAEFECSSRQLQFFLRIHLEGNWGKKWEFNHPATFGPQ